MDCDADLVKASYLQAEKYFHKDRLLCCAGRQSAVALVWLALILLAVLRWPRLWLWGKASKRTILVTGDCLSWEKELGDEHHRAIAYYLRISGRLGIWSCQIQGSPRKMRCPRADMLFLTLFSGFNSLDTLTGSKALVPALYHMSVSFMLIVDFMVSSISR